jgi:hypothetical protein
VAAELVPVRAAVLTGPRASESDRRPAIHAAIHAALDRPRLWRAAAALSALLLCALLLVCAQGSLTILARAPAAARAGRAAVRTGAGAPPAWERWCTRGSPREDRRRLAFCARVEGRVLAVTHGPAPLEAHVAVLGDFHIVIVRLPEGAETPAPGTRVVAIGPLFRARDGQREVQAFRFEAT